MNVAKAPNQVKTASTEICASQLFFSVLFGASHSNQTISTCAGGAAKEEIGKEQEKGEAGPESLASLVERTFVLAAAGNSYQMGIKAFISTIKEAYERGYTVPALTMEVSFVPTKTAGRDLHQDEVELRSIWIALVYLTLENANWPQKVQRAHEISAPFMVRFNIFPPRPNMALELL